MSNGVPLNGERVGLCISDPWAAEHRLGGPHLFGAIEQCSDCLPLTALLVRLERMIDAGQWASNQMLVKTRHVGQTFSTEILRHRQPCSMLLVPPQLSAGDPFNEQTWSPPVDPELSAFIGDVVLLK